MPVQDALERSYHVRLVVQTCGKKTAQEKDAKEPEESNMDDGESVGHGRWWMKGFSSIKVGPPKGVKTAVGQTDPGGSDWYNRENS